MKIDPQMAEVLDQLGKYNPPAIETLSPEQARNVPLLDYAARDLVASKLAARLLTVASPNPEQVASVHHLTIPGRETEILLRVYTPAGDGPFPVLIYFHGGGFVLANLDIYDSSPRALANAAECIVVSVTYRLAPEYKFPAAMEDAYSATQWVFDHAMEFNGDPNRIAIGGESAGGNLATVVCLMAIERRGALPIHQLLIYPVVDFAAQRDSYRTYASAKPLSAAMMPWFTKHYLNTQQEAENPYVSPIRARSLAGLPPATLINAEIDPLRDDGFDYSEALQAAGVPVTHHLFEGVTHEFFGLAGIVDKAREAVRQAASELKDAFNRTTVLLTPQPSNELVADSILRTPALAE